MKSRVSTPQGWTRAGGSVVPGTKHNDERGPARASHITGECNRRLIAAPVHCVCSRLGVLLCNLALYCAIIVFLPGTALAHKPSDSYLTLQVADGHLTGEWHLALRDLDDAIGLDADDDGAITWKELRTQQSGIVAYALARLQIRDHAQRAQLHVTQMLVENHSDGAYSVLRFSADDFHPGPTFEVEYHAFFDLDPLHRGLLRIEHQGTSQLAVFSPQATRQQFALMAAPRLAAPATFVHEGVWHIWTGYDHILFLIALLLPGALQRRVGRWEPRPETSLVISDVLKTVTAFTVAHSITLTLATLGWVHLPARIVESAIAASVVLAAVNNLIPLLTGRGWVIAFAFGLLHGFGFANALADLGLRRASLVQALFGFNMGVELGQLAIVSLTLPLVLLSRNQLAYRRVCLPAGSLAIGAIAAVWFVQRTFSAMW